jgi:hypothetical protein
MEGSRKGWRIYGEGSWSAGLAHGTGAFGPFFLFVISHFIDPTQWGARHLTARGHAQPWTIDRLLCWQ